MIERNGQEGHRPVAKRGRRAGWVNLMAVAALAACTSPPDAPAATQDEAAEPAQPEATEPTATTLPTDTPTLEATDTPVPTATATPFAVGGEFGPITSSGDGYTGTGSINVPVSNPSGETVEVVLPPGFVFLPAPGSNEQRLMVLQAASVTLGPGESATLDPFVACIDANAGAPGTGSSYTPGGMVEDERLQQLADCLDEQDLSASTAGFDGMGLQFAVWSVSDDFSLGEVLDIMQTADGEELDQALEEMEGGAAGAIFAPEMMGILLPFLEQANTSSERWLELCEIDS